MRLCDAAAGKSLGFGFSDFSPFIFIKSIHRVAVLDSESNTVLFLMTHTTILNYFLAATPNRAQIFGITLSDSGELHVMTCVMRFS